MEYLFSRIRKTARKPQRSSPPLSVISTTQPGISLRTLKNLAFHEPNARCSKSFYLSQALSLFLSLACPLPPSLPSSLSLPLLAFQERNARRGIHLLVLVLFAAGESGCRHSTPTPGCEDEAACARVFCSFDPRGLGTRTGIPALSWLFSNASS